MRNSIRKVFSVGAAALVILGGTPLASPKPVAATLEPPSWRIAAHPGTGSGIEAIAPDDIWLSGRPSVHFDGTSWTAIPVASDPASDPYPSGNRQVSAGAPNSVWFARGYNAGALSSCDLTAHWDGSTMSSLCFNLAQISSPNWFTEDAKDVVAFNANEAYFIGNSTSSGIGSGVLKRCTSDACTGLHSGNQDPIGEPNDDVSNIYYSTIDGTSGQDLWIGISAQIRYTDDYETYRFLGHWDGTTMTIVPSPEGDLRDMAVVSSNDIWASSNTGMLHWDGTTWSAVRSPTGAQGMDARATDDVWAVSDVIQHWDGHEWSVIDSPAATLNDVSILSADDVWAVGTDEGGVVVLHYSRPDAFSDVHYGSTFHPYIQCLSGEGIIGGYADGTFKPDNNITRGQLAKFVANAAGYSETYSTGSFTDVPTDNPFFQYIERLAHHGIIGGYADGTFKPNNTVTRGQEAKFISNAMGYGDIYSAATFTDVATNSTFFQYIERLTYHGIIGGYEDGTFKPDNDVTRGQTAKFVSNSFFPDCQAPASKDNAGLKPSK